MVNFDKIHITKKDFALMGKIATRAITYSGKRDRVEILMDLTAVHSNQPLRLADLLKANAFNFLHDIGGIGHHLNRETGELEDHFLPRFTKGK